MENSKASSLRDFQSSLHYALERLFAGTDVQTEWSAITDTRGIYSPRLDNAVGPFAVGDLQYGQHYDALAEAYSDFLSSLHQCHTENVRDHLAPLGIVSLQTISRFNYNARCFIGVEIENQVSRKHLMGGAINAAALGRFGIVVAWTSDKVRALLNLVSYLQYLGNVGKNTFQPHNLWILTPYQLMDAVNNAMPRSNRRAS